MALAAGRRTGCRTGRRRPAAAAARANFSTGRTAVLPQAASGRVALLLLGFTYDSRFAVEAWAKKFRQEFASRPAGDVLRDPHDRRPGEAGEVVHRRRHAHGARPKADYEHVITVYGGTDAWKRRVGFRDPKAAYLILLDPGGKVAWQHAGAFEEGPVPRTFRQGIEPFGRRMMRTYTLHRELLAPHPLAKVFDFFSQSENLVRITPPWMHFRILTPQPVEMKQGALIECALRVRGIPLRWLTEIERWDPPFEFVDIQAKGPYRYWRHTHRFLEVEGGTSIVDHVEYALPFGVLGRLAHRLQVGEDIARTFDYRAERVQSLLAD